MFIYHFTSLLSISLTTISYQILNPKGIKGVDDTKKSSKILLESTELDQDQYRLGNTKACYHNKSFSLLHCTFQCQTANKNTILSEKTYKITANSEGFFCF